MLTTMLEATGSVLLYDNRPKMLLRGCHNTDCVRVQDGCALPVGHLVLCDGDVSNNCGKLVGHLHRRCVTTRRACVCECECVSVCAGGGRCDKQQACSQRQTPPKHHRFQDDSIAEGSTGAISRVKGQMANRPSRSAYSCRDLSSPPLARGGAAIFVNSDCAIFGAKMRMARFQYA